MKSCPAIIAALPREVKALVDGWELRALRGGIALYTNGEAVVACGGMGRERAEMAVRAAMDAVPVSALLSAGLAGACDPALKAGEIVRAGVVVEEQTGKRFGESQSGPVLVSVDGIASVAQKAGLRASLGADAVDMEAAAVARTAQQFGLEFQAIKAISDEAEFQMDGLSRFFAMDGSFREGAFARHVAMRPWTWRKAMALGRNSSKALRALTAALQAELDLYRSRS